MSNNFGLEFKNLVIDYLAGVAPPTDVTLADVDVSAPFALFIADALRAIASTDAPRGFILEIPPGHFTLSGPGIYDIPANVQLYFCPGALLRPADDVDVVIRGSVFAGLYQIFGTDHYHELHPSPTGDTPPAGRIIFAGDLVPALYPEWWGAQFNDDLRLQFDSAPAIQATIDAACVTRDYASPDGTFAPSLPSLPVLRGERCTRASEATARVAA